MQIINIDDQAFPDLLEAWKNGKQVGRYWKSGEVQVVCATKQFLLVSFGENPRKIALKPTRSLAEAEGHGLRLLKREKDKGHEMEILLPSGTSE